MKTQKQERFYYFTEILRLISLRVFGKDITDYRWLEPKEALELAEQPGVRRDIQAFIREKE